MDVTAAVFDTKLNASGFVTETIDFENFENLVDQSSVLLVDQNGVQLVGAYTTSLDAIVLGTVADDFKLNG